MAVGMDVSEEASGIRDQASGEEPETEAVSGFTSPVPDAWSPMPDAAPLVLLAAGGPLTEREAGMLREAAGSADLRVGVDSGARHLMRVGVLPDIVTGDFDSLTDEEREDLAGRRVRIVPTPDQDFTDLDKAVRIVREEWKTARLRVYAATGGRLDHIYSVLSVLVKWGRQADIRLVDELGETWLLNGSQTLTGADLPGRTLSLMALGPVHGITTTGVRWPLTGESLAPGVRDGTLNEIIADTVTLTAETGDLLILLHHK